MCLSIGRVLLCPYLCNCGVALYCLTLGFVLPHCHSVEWVFVSLYVGVYKVRRSAHGCVHRQCSWCDV